MLTVRLVLVFALSQSDTLSTQRDYNKKKMIENDDYSKLLKFIKNLI